MKRYRCKVKRVFKSGNERIIEYVVKANSFHKAYEKIPKCRIDENIASEEIVHLALDEMKLPDKNGIKQLLESIDKLGKNGTANEIMKYRQKLYDMFRSYQPMWDDDTLSDILSYAEEGELRQCGDLDKIINMFLEELDGEWE